MITIPPEVEHLYLELSSLMDIDSYARVVGRSSLVPLHVKGRIKHELGYFLSDAQIQDFWKTLRATKAVVTGPTIRHVLCPALPSGPLTIATPIMTMLRWDCFFAGLGWKVGDGLPSTPVEVQYPPITLPSDRVPDAAPAFRDEQEPSSQFSPGIAYTRHYRKEGKYIVVHISDSAEAMDAVLGFNFTSLLSAMTETTLTCLHPGLLKHGASLYRKLSLEPGILCQEHSVGLRVGVDARDFRDCPRVIVSCRSRSYIVARDKEEVWTTIWNSDFLPRFAAEKNMVWRNGFSCRSLECSWHLV